MVHRFEDAEKWAKVFDDPARDAWAKPDEVVALLRIQGGMTVADIGAGTGYFEGRLAKAVGPKGRVLALDVEKDMVEYILARGLREGWTNVRPAKVPFDDPELGDSAVDRVLVVDTWHHIEHRPVYVGKLARALKPGGFVMIVDYTLEATRGPSVPHRIRPEVVVSELEQGGLDAEVVEETLPEHYVVIGRRGDP